MREECSVTGRIFPPSNPPRNHQPHIPPPIPIIGREKEPNKEPMIETFTPFESITRVSRDMCITEKIDGTNASVHIYEDGTLRVASRRRWIVPGDDNAGFAKWVFENEEDLRQLGVGRHFGEWWGRGIQRAYGLSEKRFSLFNTGRWNDTNVPNCCGVVPVLYQGMFSTEQIDAELERLHLNGSAAAPGFMRPEGVVIYHTASRVLFKKTLDKNDVHKFMSQE